jgi:hypothetical protein
MPRRLKVMALAFGLVACPMLFVFSGALQPATAASDTAGELAYWNKMKNSSDPADFKAYLDAYPNGMFSDIAMSKYKSLGGSAKLPTITSKSEATAKQVHKSKTVKQTKSSHKASHNRHKHLTHKKKVKHKKAHGTQKLPAANGSMPTGGGGGGGTGGGGGWHG